MHILSYQGNKTIFKGFKLKIKARNQKRRHHLNILGINWWIILKWILETKGVMIWNRFLWFGQKPMADSCTQSNKPLDPTKDREFINSAPISFLQTLFHANNTHTKKQQLINSSTVAIHYNEHKIK
jgi:hypothetical protein